MNIFVSYTHADKWQGKQIEEILENSGHNLYNHRVVVGDDRKQAELKAISDCDLFLWLLSPESVESEFCQSQFAEAIKFGKPIIPILIQSNTSIPHSIASREYADFTEGITPSGVAQLMAGIYGSTTIPRGKVKSPENLKEKPAYASVLEKQITNFSLGKPHSPNTFTFLHFFDHYYLEMIGKKTNWTKLEFEEADTAIRIALILSDRILVPVSSYFESSLCYKVVNKFNNLFPFGNINLVSSCHSVEEYIENKLDEHRPGTVPYEIYSTLNVGHSLLPPLLKRDRSSTIEIKKNWIELLEEDIAHNIYINSNIRSEVVKLGNFEENWQKTPERLENLAFVTSNIVTLLIGKDINHSLRLYNNLHAVVNYLYFKSFTEEYKASVISDLVYLRSPFELHTGGIKISYQRVIQKLHSLNLLTKIKMQDPLELINLRDDLEFMKLLEDIVSYQSPNGDLNFR